MIFYPDHITPGPEVLGLRMIAEAVRCRLKPEYRKARYCHSTNAMAGHCYHASEAFFHLTGGPKDSPWRPARMKVNGDNHYFLRDIHGTVVDVTVDQFFRLPDYRNFINCGWLTKEPSKTARAIIEQIKEDIGAHRILIPCSFYRPPVPAADYAAADS